MAIVERTRQQERRQASTQALLLAAGELILEGGFSAMTFAAIGERSGYSRSMVTARFGNKEGLVDELLNTLVSAWSAQNIPTPAEGDSGLDNLQATLDAIQRQIDKNSQGLRVLYAVMFEGLGDEAFLRERLRSFHQSLRADFAARISKGQADGSIVDDVDPEAEAAFIVTNLRGIGYQWVIDPGGFDASAAAAHFSNVVRSRLAAEGP